VALLGGQYRLREKLGEGGFGAVYAAEHRLTKRQVAIKILTVELSRNPESVQRFLHEARAATALAHPNVVDVLDMGFDETRGAYLVMERLTGESLRDHLARRGPLSPGEAIEILLPVARALAEAHDRGVVHRDIKPDNIFLAETRDGVVPKVLDFGIAKVTRQIADTTLRTRAGAVMGTPVYMSPELMSAADEATPAADVWALGAVLYEMVTGVVPFGGSSLTALFFAISQGEYTLASRQPNATATKEIDGLIAACLTRDVAKRVPNGKAFADALETLPQAMGIRGSRDRAVAAVRPVQRFAPLRRAAAMFAGAATIFCLWGFLGVLRPEAKPAPSAWLTVHSEFPEGAIDQVVYKTVASDGDVIDTRTWPSGTFPFSVDIANTDPRDGRIEIYALGIDGRTLAKANATITGIEEAGGERHVVLDAVLSPVKLASK
jgi:hypothetical protein